MGKKILIVEDEQDVLKVLAKTLATEGYSIITADNGSDAIKLAKSEHPDLIVLDILLPDMDGDDVSMILKENFETQNIPIIYLTGVFPKREEEEKYGRIVGGHVLIAKPYSLEELLVHMEKLLNGQCVHH
jgi:two-component system alkaline phosphatase synthesis response regulator PhoP